VGPAGVAIKLETRNVLDSDTAEGLKKRLCEKIMCKQCGHTGGVTAYFFVTRRLVEKG